MILHAQSMDMKRSRGQTISIGKHFTLRNVSVQLTSLATLFQCEPSRLYYCKHVNHSRQLRLSCSCVDHVHLFIRRLRVACLVVTSPCSRCVKRESMRCRSRYLYRHQLTFPPRCIFSGSSHPALVEAICGRLGQRRADVTLGTFSTIGKTRTI